MLRKMTLILLSICLLITAYTHVVLAQVKYSIKEMTPEVNAALESRRDRFDKLRELKSKGTIGENNRGYVEVLVKVEEPMVEAENQDRKLIYETIAKQNGLEGALDTIEKVFAQVQRDKAEKGENIQNEDGTWVSK